MIFNFGGYDQLLPLVTNSLIVGAMLAVVGGLVGVFVINRDMSFAVHGISEMKFCRSLDHSADWRKRCVRFGGRFASCSHRHRSHGSKG